jgi:hypothetical protein
MDKVENELIHKKALAAASAAASAFMASNQVPSDLRVLFLINEANTCGLLERDGDIDAQIQAAKRAAAEARELVEKNATVHGARAYVASLVKHGSNPAHAEAYVSSLPDVNSARTWLATANVSSDVGILERLEAKFADRLSEPRGLMNHTFDDQGNARSCWNACYLNSIIQALLSAIFVFVFWFLKTDGHIRICESRP